MNRLVLMTAVTLSVFATAVAGYGTGGMLRLRTEGTCNASGSVNASTWRFTCTTAECTPACVQGNTPAGDDPAISYCTCNAYAGNFPGLDTAACFKYTSTTGGTTTEDCSWGNCTILQECKDEDGSPGGKCKCK